MRGTITQWKDDKGFGFIVSEDGGEKLFFHISAVKTQGRRPQVHDVVLYESMRDSQGRLKAKAVVIEGAVSSAPKTYSKNRIHTEPSKKDALDYVAIVLLIGAFAGGAYSFIQSGRFEKLIPAGVVLIIAVVLLNRQKMPKEKIFSCARCRKMTDHDKRTINAWNNGFLKLYCNACHQKWLADQPKQTQHISVSSRSGGCLGILALLVILPIMVGVGVYQWIV